MSGRVRLVVTDMDNTLYSWVNYIVPAVDALVESVCRSTGYPKLRVVQALKAVYARYESNEYPFALQESALYAEFPDFPSFDKLVIEPARHAFSSARRKYLQLYPGVKKTLETLKSKGLTVVALTDAPRNPAEGRARMLELDGLLDAIYTLPGFQFPESKEGEVKLVAPDILRREEQGLYRAKCKVVELPREHEKPHPGGLERICMDFGVSPEETLVIGDSVGKDVAVARRVGAIDCWAEYGTYVSHEYRERLDIISAAAITRRHAAGVMESATDAPATHRFSNFSQLLALVS